MGFLGVLVFLAQTLQPVDLKTTSNLDVAPGCSIRILGSEGELNIEAWDQPRVELTVSRYTFTETGKDKVLDRIQVSAKKTGANEVTISTETPGRNALTRATHGLTGVDIEYHLRVPKDSNLVIRHGAGDVMIQGVAGNIDARARNAEVVVFLPAPGAWAIHAKSKFGIVDSDFDGVRKHVFPFGARFDSPAASPAKTIDLETGNGGITIEREPVRGEQVLTSSR